MAAILMIAINIFDFNKYPTRMHSLTANMALSLFALFQRQRIIGRKSVIVYIQPSLDGDSVEFCDKV